MFAGTRVPRNARVMRPATVPATSAQGIFFSPIGGRHTHVKQAALKPPSGGSRATEYCPSLYSIQVADFQKCDEIAIIDELTYNFLVFAG